MSPAAETFPPPNHPIEFESLCLDLWEEIWNDPGAQKHGRSGQPKAGVDVFGRMSGKWVGVQCKQKSGLLRTQVTVSELDHEVAEARNFKPELSAFILATTGPADAKVQQRARELTEEHEKRGLFSVEVWDWTKIWHELYRREELLERIGPVYWPQTWRFIKRRYEPTRGKRMGGVGALHFVPDLPPHFLPRAEALTAVKSRLLGEGAPRVAITGRGQAVGVQGMGGIGKSVLAAAVAQEPDVRRAFPDGVVWLTVGQKPNLIELQGRLLRVLTGAVPAAATVHEGTDAIRQALKGRRVLLILDDVWEAGHATLFRGIPKGCRLLVTTRSAEVLTGLEASEFQVDLLTPEESLRLLADWSGLAQEALPAEAPEIVRECAQLPLALAAIGAMVRLGPTAWKDALTRLRRADLDAVHRAFPDYPYPHLLRALEASVEALPPEDRERYLDLAVFPEEIAIPEAPLRLLWRLDDLDTRDTMRRLAARSLAKLKESGGEGLSLTLHDLQRDLVQKQRKEQVPQLHARLVEAYHAVCRARMPMARNVGGTKWSRGPNDGYFFQRLAWHLVQAGRTGELRTLLMDFEWQQAKLEATDVVGLIADYDQLAEDSDLGLTQSAIRNSAHALGRDRNQLASQLSGRLSGEQQSAIQRLVAGAAAWRGAPWLRPLNTNLHSPGTALIRTLQGHAEGVRAVALSADGGRAVSGSDDQTLKVWDLPSGQELRTIEGHAGGVTAVALTADGRRVVSGSEDQTLKVWDLESGRELRTLNVHAGVIHAVALSADGRWAVCGSDDGTLKVWNIESGRELTLKGHAGEVHAVALSADGGRAVSGSYDQTLKVWDVESGREMQTLKGHDDWVNAVALSGDGRRAVSGSEDNTLKVWDVESGRAVRTLKGHAGVVWAVALSADGRRAVSGSEDSTLKVWDVERGRELGTLKGHDDWVTAVTVSADGRRAVSGSEDNTLKVWDIERGRELQTLKGHARWVTAVALSADGRRAVSGSGDQTLTVWDIERGRELRALKGHAGRIRAVALSADGRRAVSGSEDNTLKVWYLETGRELRTLRGHAGWVRAVALSADGRRAVSGSRDQTLKVWDVESGEVLATFTGESAIISAALASDQRTVVAGERSGRIHFLRLVLPDDLVEEGETAKCRNGGMVKPRQIARTTPKPMRPRALTGRATEATAAYGNPRLRQAGQPVGTPPHPMLTSEQLLSLLGPLGDNAVTLPMLVRQARSPLGVVPFVGAGMSVPFKFPQWGEFLEGLAPDDEKKQAIHARLKVGEYEEAAQDLMDWRGAGAFQDALDHAFGPAQLEGKDPKGAVSLLPRLTKGPVLTTNFDHVLERVFAAAGSPFERVILGIKTDLIRDAFNRNLRCLIKLHGDAADRTDRVLTRREYETRYGMAEPLRPVLEFAMRHPLLFLGCSLQQDRTVRVLESLHQGLDIVHYAILEIPADDQVFAERRRFLSERGIRAVWFPTRRFDLIEELLNYLAA